MFDAATNQVTYAVALKPSFARPGEMKGPAEMQPGARAPNRERHDMPAKYRKSTTSGLVVTVVRGENSFDIAMLPTGHDK